MKNNKDDKVVTKPAIASGIASAGLMANAARLHVKEHNIRRDAWSRGYEASSLKHRHEMDQVDISSRNPFYAPGREVSVRSNFIPAAEAIHMDSHPDARHQKLLLPEHLRRSSIDKLYNKANKLRKYKKLGVSASLLSGAIYAGMITRRDGTQQHKK